MGDMQKMIRITVDETLGPHEVVAVYPPGMRKPLVVPRWMRHEPELTVTYKQDPDADSVTYRFTAKYPR